jgi:uncharacterized protein (TIGR03435 family)
MIRRSLAGRFRLAMRVEKKRMSVYALSVGSGGPKLQKSPVTDEECTFGTRPGREPQIEATPHVEND